jgi:hypothetical protein
VHSLLCDHANFSVQLTSQHRILDGFQDRGKLIELSDFNGREPLAKFNGFCAVMNPQDDISSRIFDPTPLKPRRSINFLAVAIFILYPSPLPAFKDFALDFRFRHL